MGRQTPCDDCGAECGGEEGFCEACNWDGNGTAYCEGCFADNFSRTCDGCGDHEGCGECTETFDECCGKTFCKKKCKGAVTDDEGNTIPFAKHTEVVLECEHKGCNKRDECKACEEADDEDDEQAAIEADTTLVEEMLGEAESPGLRAVLERWLKDPKDENRKRERDEHEEVMKRVNRRK